MKTIEIKPDAKILIIQLRRIGDVLLTTPVIRALREKYPTSRLDFLVEKPGAEILAGNPYINTLLVYDKRAHFTWIGKIRSEKYDLVLDFLRNPRTSLITLLSGAKYRACFKKPWRDYACNLKVEPDPAPKYVPAYKLDLLKPLGITNSNTSLDLKVDPTADQNMGTFLMQAEVAKSDLLVGISPTSRRAARIWRAEGFAEIADNLIRKYKAKVIFLWGPGEEEKIDGIISLMKEKPFKSPLTTIAELVALISRLKLMITNDNGPMHMAQGLNIPNVVIFGPTQSVNWSEPGPKNIVVKAAADCLECNNQECDSMKCMELVTPEMVEAAIRKTGTI